MKKNPYAEIIDLDKEVKEYKKLCRCKSKKFTYYTEWEKHIRELLSKFASEKDLYNFKRYCINYERTAKLIPSFYINFMVLYLTIFIDKFIKELNILIWLFLFLLSVLLTLCQNLAYSKEAYFYRDIIEIIEDFQQQ